MTPTSGRAQSQAWRPVWTNYIVWRACRAQCSNKKLETARGDEKQSREQPREVSRASELGGMKNRIEFTIASAQICYLVDSTGSVELV